MDQEPRNPDSGFERLALAVESLVKQERWTRRFANLLKFAVFAYIVFFIFMASENLMDSEEFTDLSETQQHTAVVKLEGAIMPGSQTSAEKFNPLLKKAFSNKNSKAVIILANSPGGSAVQSALINDEIERLKQKYEKPIYVVVEDMCASGCYYVAVAADKIYANKSSMIGSIGVRMDTFGFTELMENMGIENRSMHAGEHKTFIDPFGEKDEAGRAFFQKHVLERTHQHFIDAVREGRGERIKETDETYTGLVWLGDDAVDNGMIDGLGDVGHVAREIAETKHIRYYNAQKTLVEELLGDIGTQTANKLALYLSTVK